MQFSSWGRDETIVDLQGYAHDHANKLVDLEDDIEEDQAIRESFEKTHTFDYLR